MSNIVCHFTSVHPADDIRIFHKECTSLAEKGYEVHLVAPGVLPPDAKGVIHHAVPVDSSSGRLKRIFFRSFTVYRMAKATQASIFHFHDPELLPYGLLLKVQGKTVIYDAHEDLPRDVMMKDWLPAFVKPILAWFTEKIENFIARRLDVVVTATPHICKRFNNIGAKAVVLNNFPKLDELYIRPVDFNNDSISICYVGLISLKRGILEMIQSAETLGVRLILAGAFTDDKTKNLVHSLPGWRNVDYRGVVGRQGIAQIFFESRVGLCLLHPSVTYDTSLPIKLFEYMSAELPVIASNFTLWRDIVESSNSGLCVDPLNSSDCTKAIEWMLNNPVEAKKMAENGRTAVLDQYNWTTEANRLLDVYQKLVQPESISWQAS